MYRGLFEHLDESITACVIGLRASWPHRRRHPL